MPYDPNSRFFRPDFQANSAPPEWVQFPDQTEETAAGVGTFAKMLKQKMAGGGGEKGGAMAGMEGKAGGGGGGMSSL